MHCLWMKKPANITCRSDGACRRPFELEHEHHLISHPSCPTQDGFDGRVDRLHHAEADGMVAVSCDPLDVLEEELAQSVHLRQPLPPQRVDPAVQEGQYAGSRLVRPEAIELLPQ